jgi:hypothetical protein
MTAPFIERTGIEFLGDVIARLPEVSRSSS